MKSFASLATVLTSVALGSAQGPAVQGLDHIPIAVNDLAVAADDYRALGFSLKPGRPHENGITNQHVKFRDGTELELITAPPARDALTTFARLTVHVPDALSVEVARLGEGEVVFLPGSRQVVKGRRIVGATLRVKDVAAARQRVPKARVEQGSLFLPPERAHGLWLEFRATK